MQAQQPFDLNEITLESPRHEADNCFEHLDAAAYLSMSLPCGAQLRVHASDINLLGIKVSSLAEALTEHFHLGFHEFSEPCAAFLTLERLVAWPGLSLLRGPSQGEC